VTHCITASIAHAQLPWHRQLHEMVESFALRQLPPQPVAVSGVSSLLSSLLSSIEDAISAQRLLSAHRTLPADADAIGAPVSEEQANISTNPTTTNTPGNSTTSSKSPRERRRGDKKATAIDLAEAARAKEAASMLATRAAVMSSVSAECLQSLSVEVATTIVCATSSFVGRGSCGASKAAPHDTRPT
jgi:hypothetical protein